MEPMSKHVIVAIHVTDRVKQVSEIQRVLTEFGCFIKTRLGLHEASSEYCAAQAVILLEMLDDEAKHRELMEQLAAIEGVEVDDIVFDH